jgi:DNA-binding transcriptional MerR regulator
MANRRVAMKSTFDEIPDKIYYSISEVSEFTGVEPHVLRYWETKFAKLNPKRVGGNQRKYTRNDLNLIYDIIHLLYSEGFTLDGAERKLRNGYSKGAGKAAKSAPKPDSVNAKVTQLPTTANQEAMASQNEQILDELASIKTELRQILTLLD